MAEDFEERGTVLRMEGTVRLGDECRVSSGYEDDNLDGSVWVGDADVVDIVGSTKWNGPVTFAFGDSRWSGDISAELGWGYSEYTPMDSDRLFVGPHDIIGILCGHAGEHVTVWFADRPFNTLDPEDATQVFGSSEKED